MGKALSTIVVIIFFASFAFGQKFSAGGTVDILVGGETMNYMFGPRLLIEYKSDEFPLAFLASAHFYLSEITGKSIYLGGFTYTTFGFGAAAYYYPLSWAIEPYIGAGGVYNSNRVEQAGNANFIDGKWISLQKFNDNFSFELIGGLKFAANTPINFIVEITYKLHRPAYEVALISIDSSKEISNKKLNLNSTFIKLGLLFRL